MYVMYDNYIEYDISLSISMKCIASVCLEATFTCDHLVTGLL